MNRRPQRWLARLATMTVLAAGAVVAVASPGQAAISGIQVREITGAWNVNPGSTSANALYCGSGEKVLQGGALSQTLSTGVYVLASYSNASNRWYWVVYNDTTTTQEVHARAICASGVDGWETKWGSGTVPAASSANITSVSCPSGKTSIGGGWVNQVNTELGDWFVSSSYPSSNAWRIRVRNNSAWQQAPSVQAICTSQTGRTWSSYNTTVNPGSTKWKTNTCGASEWLVGGGFKTNEDSSYNIVTAAIPQPRLARVLENQPIEPRLCRPYSYTRQCVPA